MPTKVPAYAAAAARAPLGPVTIERRDVGPPDVGIEILHCGICHSDVHKVNNEWENTHFPIVPGHEIVGRVTSVGAEVRDVRVGDLVGVGCMVDSCRVCPQCRAGHEMFCEKGVIFTFDSFDAQRGAWTQGGYSTYLVVDERFVLRIPNGLDPARAAPLLCAGITTYSPLRQFDCKPGDQVAIVGLGGLGHLAVKLASAMGAEVTVLSTSPEKAKDASRFGASHFVITRDPHALDPFVGKFDLIVDTASGGHDMNSLTALLRPFGTLVLVGLPAGGVTLDASGLVHGDKRVAGSNIGGIRETQEMLDFCGEHGIVAEVEAIRADQINDAYARMQRDDVRYRFVINAGSFGRTSP